MDVGPCKSHRGTGNISLVELGNPARQDPGQAELRGLGIAWSKSSCKSHNLPISGHCPVYPSRSTTIDAIRCKFSTAGISAMLSFEVIRLS